MRFEKQQDIEVSIDDDDLQIPASDDLDDEKTRGSLTLSERNVSPIENKKKRIMKLLNYIKFSLILYTTIYILFKLNTQYFEINQICPYKTDFDCFYRYLVCEGECSDMSQTLKEKDFDFSYEGPRKDGFFFNTRLAHIIVQLATISFIFSIILALGIFIKRARIYIIIVVANIYYLRTYRDGDPHGDYTNILGNWLIVLVSGLASLYTLVIILGKINSKGKGYAWTVFVTVIISILFAFYGIVHRFTGSCDNWDKGLYGERIDNNVNCQFSKPGFCIYEFLGDIYDYNKWLMITCEDRKPHWDLMDEKYPNTSRVGFPLMKDMTKLERQFNNVPVYVDNHLQEVNDDNEKDFEVVLHRTWDNSTNSYRDPAWIDINVQFNHELVAQRSNLVSPSIVDNVMVIYIDTLSRAAAMRRLPETMKTFEKMTPKMHQFFKYHSIGPYTLANMYPMFYGIPRPKTVIPYAEEKKSFIHQYKNNGFITGRALSHCALSALNTYSDEKYYNQVDEEPFDHTGLGWACEVNARPHTLNEATTGPTSLLRRCVYGKDLSEYVIDYGKKFWKTYKNQKKFLWLDFLDFHDFTFSQGKYLDGHLSKFLSEIDLSDTLLLLISDHGQHVLKNQALKSFKSVMLEKAAPTLFVKLPQNLESVYGYGLEENKQQLVKAYDLYKLFMAIPNPDQIGDTFFNPLPEKTTSCDFPIVDQDCQCKLPKK